MRRVLLATSLGFGVIAVASHAIGQESPFTIPPSQSQPGVNSTTSRPLPARSDSSSATALADSPRRGSGSTWGTLVALAAVIALILATGKIWRRFAPAASQALSDQAVNILGRKPLDSKHSLTLVKCGSRILVLGFSPHGMHTLTEISDAGEVDLLAGLCATVPTESRATPPFRDLWKQTATQEQSTVEPDHHDATLMERYADSHA